jgi:hypothetical protein
MCSVGVKPGGCGERVTFCHNSGRFSGCSPTLPSFKRGTVANKTKASFKSTNQAPSCPTPFICLVARLSSISVQQHSMLNHAAPEFVPASLGCAECYDGAEWEEEEPMVRMDCGVCLLHKPAAPTRQPSPCACSGLCLTCLAGIELLVLCRENLRDARKP